ncbi:MAG: hypothetical protein MJ087_05370 [Lachnospiraceae bacterium]|nr:hypothetical protein [Lachnospiraceae bacterium]
MNFIEELLTLLFNTVSKFGLDLVKAVLIIAIGFKLSKFAVKHFKKMMKASMIEDSVGSFLTSIVRIGSKALVIVLAVGCSASRICHSTCFRRCSNWSCTSGLSF